MDLTEEQFKQIEQILFNAKKEFNYSSMLELASNISEWYKNQYEKLLNMFFNEIKNIMQEKYNILTCTWSEYLYETCGLMYYLKDAEHSLNEEEALKINSVCRYSYANIPKSSTSPIFISAIIINDSDNINSLDFCIANARKDISVAFRNLSVDKNALNVCDFENKELFKKAVITGVEWLEKMFLNYGVIKKIVK